MLWQNNIIFQNSCQAVDAEFRKNAHYSVMSCLEKSPCPTVSLLLALSPQLCAMFLFALFYISANFLVVHQEGFIHDSWYIIHFATCFSTFCPDTAVNNFIQWKMKFRSRTLWWDMSTSSRLGLIASNFLSTNAKARLNLDWQKNVMWYMFNPFSFLKLMTIYEIINEPLSGF